MHMTRFLTRSVFLQSLAVGLLILVLGGCSSHKPVVTQKQAKVEKQKLELNPLKWDFKKADYNFREKYHFKVGSLWIIKPPRVFNPSQVVVVRELSNLPDEPVSQDNVRMIYEQYIQQQDTTRTLEVLVGSDAKRSQATLAEARLQRMVIDLGTCDAIFEDVDGKKYPWQIDPSIARRILDLTTDSVWLRKKNTKIKQVNPDEWCYRALFQEMDSQYKPVKRSWKISETSVNANVSATQKLLTQAFEVASRAVHPLSESVDLLK